MNAIRHQQIGKYQLLDRIAAGGMAELYRAKIIGEQGFEKLVAVKRILPHLADEEALVNAFIDEARLAALLHHPNIVQIFDLGQVDGAYFIAMEYLDGKDLQQIIRLGHEKEQPMGLELSLHLAISICEGLSYAHSLVDANGEPLHIIHRDISPQNIFITFDGQVKIIDFGIAKAASQNTRTQAGVIKGKAAYMSPEQAAGEDTDHRSDLFSAGILLFELIAHRPLFQGDTFQILSRLRQFDPSEMITAATPTAFHAVLKKALARNPDQRYRSATDMRKDLEKCLGALDLRPDAHKLSAYTNGLLGERKVIPISVPTASSEKKRTAFDDTGAVHIGNEKTAAWVPGDSLMETEAVCAPSEKKPALRLKFRAIAGAAWAAIALMLIALIMFTVGIPVFKNGSRPTGNLQAASAALAAKQYAESVARFEQAVYDNPSLESKIAGMYSKALCERASELIEADPGLAENLLLKSVRLDPESRKGYFKLGQLYLAGEDYPRAIDSYKKAAALDPKFAKTFFNLGYVYMHTGDYALAEQMYRQVVALSPPYLDEALFNLAMAYEKLGRRQACIRNLKQAVAVNPDNQRARQVLQRFDL